MEKLEKRKIKNILILPRFQIKYIGWLSVTSLSLIFILCLIFFYFIKENYLILVDLSPMDELARQQLYSELIRLKFYLFGASFIFLTCVLIMGLLFSHKVAGPIFHFRRVMMEVSGGNLSARVHLRPGDEFAEIADVFNKMLDGCEQRCSKS